MRPASHSGMLAGVSDARAATRDVRSALALLVPAQQPRPQLSSAPETTMAFLSPFELAARPLEKKVHEKQTKTANGELTPACVHGDAAARPGAAVTRRLTRSCVAQLVPQ
mmetsp:Transcript_36778/g.83240  ORF Transcript_36778/g.83240 Transcript_36778/m.83240 type:complete len:110 (-) Transcript_36778:187-516(-)